MPQTVLGARADEVNLGRSASFRFSILIRWLSGRDLADYRSLMPRWLSPHLNPAGCPHRFHSFTSGPPDAISGGYTVRFDGRKKTRSEYESETGEGGA